MMIIKDSINLPVTRKPQFIRPKLESQCRNIRHELNQLSIKSTCVMSTFCHNVDRAIAKVLFAILKEQSAVV